MTTPLGVFRPLLPGIRKVDLSDIANVRPDRVRDVRNLRNLSI
jgi:hypothetical protein